MENRDRKRQKLCANLGVFLGVRQWCGFFCFFLWSSIVPFPPKEIFRSEGNRKKWTLSLSLSHCYIVSKLVTLSVWVIDLVHVTFTWEFGSLSHFLSYTSVIFATDHGFNTFAVLNMETGVSCGRGSSSDLALPYGSQFIIHFLKLNVIHHILS